MAENGVMSTRRLAGIRGYSRDSRVFAGLAGLAEALGERPGSVVVAPRQWFGAGGPVGSWDAVYRPGWIGLTPAGDFERSTV